MLLLLLLLSPLLWLLRRLLPASPSPLRGGKLEVSRGGHLREEVVEVRQRRVVVVVVVRLLLLLSLLLLLLLLLLPLLPLGAAP